MEQRHGAPGSRLCECLMEFQSCGPCPTLTSKLFLQKRTDSPSALLALGTQPEKKRSRWPLATKHGVPFLSLLPASFESIMYRTGPKSETDMGLLLVLSTALQKVLDSMGP